MSPPAVILVRPQMGENIGAVARAMMNFGLRELRLVAPRDGWPNAKAAAMAAHAEAIVSAARVFSTLAEAVADLEYLVGTTARSRRLSVPSLTPREAAAALAVRCASRARAGILFGPERAGLETDETALCTALVTIPADPANTSLNLAQSAVILAYEWWLAAAADEKRSGQAQPRAGAGALDALHRGMMETLLARGYFTAPDRLPAVRRNLRAMLAKANLTVDEAESLYGIVRALAGDASR